MMPTGTPLNTEIVVAAKTRTKVSSISLPIAKVEYGQKRRDNEDHYNDNLR